jgi:SAM-dependent methyltransferase
VRLVERVHDGVVFGRRVRVLAGHISRLIDSGARVLDVGCGDGSIARAIMELRPDVDIVGIDVLVRPAAHIEVTAFDGRTIPFDDDSFDTVSLVDVLHHTVDPPGLLREAARVASTVVVKDHLVDGFLARPTLRLMDWVGNAHFGVALPYNYWTADRWRRTATELGLTMDEWRTELGLHPRPASWLFDRRLHLLARLSRPPAGRRGSGGDRPGWPGGSAAEPEKT